MDNMMRFVCYGDVIVLRSSDPDDAQKFGYINGNGMVSRGSSEADRKFRLYLARGVSQI